MQIHCGIFSLSDYVFKEKTIQDSKEKLCGVHEETALKSEFHQIEKLPKEDISNVTRRGILRTFQALYDFIHINRFHDKQHS